MMTQYSNVAILVVDRFQLSKIALNPELEWDYFAKQTITSKSSREKPCPKNTFLGLCSFGCILGISPGSYTDSVENKRYGLEAVHLLRKNNALSTYSARRLWEIVMSSLCLHTSKKHNGQMNIVLDLWNRGYVSR